MRNFHTDALARPLALQALQQPFEFEPYPLTQRRLEAMTDDLKTYGFSVKRNAELLAFYLAPKIAKVEAKPLPTMTTKEIEAETERLNALPKDKQLITYCDAMGFSVIEYLREKAKFNGEVLNEIEWLEIGADNATHG